MPYISQDERPIIDEWLHKVPWFVFNRAGRLNYVITKLVQAYASNLGGYAAIAEVTGVLENVKQEFYRRHAAPYEDTKVQENGDVY